MDKKLAELPDELNKFKIVLNPIRLALIKLLYYNYKLPASELKEMIGITWGSWQKHLQVLENAGLVRTKREFLDSRPRVMVSLKEFQSSNSGKLFCNSEWATVKKYSFTISIQ